MKYGVLVVTPVSCEADRSFINIGDMIQTEAILYVYEKMGIGREDVVRLELRDVNQYSGEYLILPININLSFNWIINIFPLPSRIIPVFLGLSYFSAEKFPQELADYFRFYAPIGCRDEFTLQIMRSNHVPAYLYGCVSAVLPRLDREEGNRLFLVDIPESFMEYWKEKIGTFEEIEIISHIWSGNEVSDKNYIERKAEELLKKYHDEARLVVTSRLHCMSPCMAMGIPVIPVTDNISPRMGWIDRFLKIYTPETYHLVEWNGQVAEYEDTKQLMLEIAIDKIQKTAEYHKKTVELSYFYETRFKSEYGNYYRRMLEKLPQNRMESLQYVLWGAGQIGINAYQVICEMFPESCCRAVIDSYCTGEFFGISIEKPDALDKYSSAFIFITTMSGEACAIHKLEQMGKRQGIDYISMATTAG